MSMLSRFLDIEAEEHDSDGDGDYDEAEEEDIDFIDDGTSLHDDELLPAPIASSPPARRMGWTRMVDHLATAFAGQAPPLGPRTSVSPSPLEIETGSVTSPSVPPCGSQSAALLTLSEEQIDKFTRLPSATDSNIFHLQCPQPIDAATFLLRFSLHKILDYASASPERHPRITTGLPPDYPEMFTIW